MALPTLLDLVNKMLIRMREEEVTAIVGDEYATLVKAFVNDAKSQVEDAHDWSAYLTDIVVTTAAGTTGYSLTGSGNRIKIDTVVNTTAPGVMKEMPRRKIKQEILLGTIQDSRPSYWANNGVDASGDAQVLLYPNPVATESLTFTGWVRPAALDADTDTLTIPELPVVLLALSFMARERGEVGGTTSAEYFELAKRSLGDEIAYDSARNDDEDTWYWS